MPKYTYATKAEWSMAFTMVPDEQMSTGWLAEHDAQVAQQVRSALLWKPGEHVGHSYHRPGVPEPESCVCHAPRRVWVAAGGER